MEKTSGRAVLNNENVVRCEVALDVIGSYGGGNWCVCTHEKNYPKRFVTSGVLDER